MFSVSVCLQCVCVLAVLETKEGCVQCVRVLAVLDEKEGCVQCVRVLAVLDEKKAVFSVSVCLQCWMRRRLCSVCPCACSVG